MDVDCLEYSEATELFNELVNDISSSCAIETSVQEEVMFFYLL